MHQQVLRSSAVVIGGHRVGPEHPCFVIGEIGINHNGSVQIAKHLIDLAARVGCQAVKFQKRTVDVVYGAEELEKPRTFDDSFIANASERSKAYGYEVLPKESAERLRRGGGTTNGDLKYALEFNEPEYRELGDYCARKNILWSASPWDEGAVEFLESFDVPFYKIASASLTDAGLLRAVRKTGKPVVLSTGMSTMKQIRTAASHLGGSPLVLLHCVSTYPAKDEDLNLLGIQTLRREFPDIPVGYSGHENGSTLAVAAVALGACIIERHITLDRTMPGSDQAASLEPFRLELMLNNIRRLEKAMGSGEKRIHPVEVPVMEKLRRKTDF